MRPPSSAFMLSLGNCRVLVLQKTQPPLRGEKGFILMKTGYVNTSLCLAVLLHLLKRESDLLLIIKVGGGKV